MTSTNGLTFYLVVSDHRQRPKAHDCPSRKLKHYLFGRNVCYYSLHSTINADSSQFTCSLGRRPLV